MTAFLHALTSFLSAAGLPVYPDDAVPDGTPYPYMTCPMRLTGFGGTARLTLTGWFRDTEDLSAAAARQRFFDKASALLPESGVTLRYAEGMAVLHRGSGDFLSCVCDGVDHDILGGRVRLTLRCYNI